jgi:hypothetical protein
MEARGNVNVQVDAGMEGLSGGSLRRWARLALGLGALGLLGCGAGAKGDCPALDTCLGNPAGSWKITGPADSCQVPIVRPMQPVDVTEFTSHASTPQAPTIAPPQANPVVVQQSTSGDWCSNLVLNPDDTVSNANLWHEMPELIDGTFKLFDADHSYTTQLIFSTKNFPAASNTTHFAPRCLLASGGGHPDATTGLPGPGTCDALGTGLTRYYVPLLATVPPSFNGVDGGPIKCTLAADAGCDCVAAYTVQVDDAGTWTLPAGEPGTLLQESGLGVFMYNGVSSSSQSPAMTMRSSFCAGGNRLQLTGPNGGSLFTIQGLRTMVLSPM